MNFLYKAFLCTGLLVIGAVQAGEDVIVIENKHHDSMIIKESHSLSAKVVLREGATKQFRVPKGDSSLSLYCKIDDQEHYICSFNRPGKYSINYPFRLLYYKYKMFGRKGLQAPVLDIFRNKQLIGNVCTKNSIQGDSDGECSPDIILKLTPNVGIVHQNVPKTIPKNELASDPDYLEMIKIAHSTEKKPEPIKGLDDILDKIKTIEERNKRQTSIFETLINKASLFKPGEKKHKK